jgi:hypothetical protein
VSIEDELKKEIALLTRENQQLTHQLFDYRAAFIRARDREWVGLTVDEIDKFMPYCHTDQDLSDFRTFAFEIEDKLKEKNG